MFKGIESLRYIFQGLDFMPAYIDGHNLNVKHAKEENKRTVILY